MPRIISKRPLRHRAHIAMADIERLAWGFYLLHPARPCTPEELAQIWAQIGESLTRLHAEYFPGTRPWGWWEFQAPERRRRVDGPMHPHDNPARQASVPNDLCYGMPNTLQLPDDFAACYESQAAYIERLKLWLPGEKTRQASQSSDETDDAPAVAVTALATWSASIFNRKG